MLLLRSQLNTRILKLRTSSQNNINASVTRLYSSNIFQESQEIKRSVLTTSIKCGNLKMWQFTEQNVM
jgi:hypothetical protein